VYLVFVEDIMKKFLKAVGIIAIVAIIGFSFVTCSDDEDDGGYSGGGGGNWNGSKSLKGTIWELRYTSSDADYTYTLNFTSDDMLTITKTGWYEITVYGNSTNGYKNSKRRDDVNRSYNGTYTYYTNIKEGWMNSDFWSSQTYSDLWNFKISSDDRSMIGKIDTWIFTRK